MIQLKISFKNLPGEFSVGLLDVPNNRSKNFYKAPLSNIKWIGKLSGSSVNEFWQNTAFKSNVNKTELTNLTLFEFRFVS